MSILTETKKCPTCGGVEELFENLAEDTYIKICNRCGEASSRQFVVNDKGEPVMSIFDFPTYEYEHNEGFGISQIVKDETAYSDSLLEEITEIGRASCRERV